MLSLASLPPLSLYIHIPWCVKKCPYCDFNSHQIRSNGEVDFPEQEYISALIDDLTQQLPQVWGRRLHSIFIGGGTPSLFSASGIDNLLSNVRALLPFQTDIEITLEANPGTAEAQKFKDFFAAGVNRLSMGIQSFDDAHLKTLGRIHSGNEALKAIEFAHNAGFKKFNLDLMHGLPHQTPEQAQQDLNTAIKQGVNHISWYQLTLEPNTLFFAKPPKLPEEDYLVDIQNLGETALSAAGFEQYEISAFAKEQQHQSQHNLNYWTFGDYLAIGAGAHGKITLPADNKIVRYHQYRNPKDYLNPEKNYTLETNNIQPEDLPLEFMMNVLRLKQKIPVRLFNERTGLPWSAIEPGVIRAVEDNLIALDSEFFQVTDRGHRYLNDLLEMFLAESIDLPKTINIKQID
ncbi:MAG: oxygen-independent coproporphyrinogen III oxidase-like protein [Gammaproteobacteria bacterium]|nr:oxygen-independent coproporphyrinogen III oxidase-like protein [Gammaproteobacteria bacterium]